MYIKKNSSTPRQWAYARNKLAGAASTKRELAKISGYGNGVAHNTSNKIEKSKGYKNAITELSLQSNSLLLKVMGEFDRRDLEEFSNKDLVTALNSISSAWSKIDTQRQMNKNKNPENNPLRSIFMKRSGDTPKVIEAEEVTQIPIEDKEEEVPRIEKKKLTEEQQKELEQLTRELNI